MSKEVPGRMVGTELLFENDRVRVWDFKLAPGEATQLHSHTSDYFFVYLTPDNVLDIHVPEGDDYVQRSPEGFVGFFEIGENPGPIYTHRAKNIADRPHRQIVVELLKPTGTPAEPDAVS